MGGRGKNGNGPEVTIVIPNYNGAEFLLPCLNALTKQTYPAPVLVVDDGSEDESLKVLRSFIEEREASGEKDGILSISLLTHETNLGFAAAVNTGIKASETPYVLLLNNDTEAAPQMTEELHKTISEHPKCFSVQGRLLQADDPDLIDDAGDYYCALGWAFSPGRDRAAEDYTRRAYVTSCCAGAAIYRRELLTGTGEDAVGLFDEAHFCYLEDVDIGIRALRMGYRNIYEPRAVVLHKGSATSGSRYNDFKERLTAANNLYLLYKNFPVWMLVLNAPLIIAGVLIKLAYFSRKGYGHAYRRGLILGAQRIYLYGERRFSSPRTTLRRDLSFEIELLVNCLRRILG